MEIISLSAPIAELPYLPGRITASTVKARLSSPLLLNIADMPLPQISKYADSYKKTLAENPDSQDLNLSIGICYLRLKMYEKASASFEKAMEDNFDNPEPFFLAAVSLLRGKKPFVTLRPVIDKNRRISECRSYD